MTECSEPFQLQHVALTVADLDRSIQFYDSVFGVEVVERRPARFLNPTGAMEVAFVQAGTARLELIGPTESSAPRGSILPQFHIAFATRSLGEGIARLTRLGLTLTVLPEAGDPVVAFVHDPDGYLIELFAMPDGAR